MSNEPAYIIKIYDPVQDDGNWTSTLHTDTERMIGSASAPHLWTVWDMLARALRAEEDLLDEN